MTIPDHLLAPFADLLLAVADDKLMLGHRNSDWTGLAPILEEDIAFSSLAQDEIAHAQAIYRLVAELTGGDADDIAFGRAVDAYRCCEVVEVPDDFDWATAICRQFFCDHYDEMRLGRLSRSNHAPVAALARRLHAEELVHIQHVDGWIRRLGTGTDESRQRLEHAMSALSPIAATLLEPVDGESGLEESGLYPSDGDDFDRWSTALRDVAWAASLELTLEPPAADFVGGRHGRHHAGFASLLDEMCEVYRIEPGVAW